MNHFIITAILALAAVKAKSQARENLTNPKRREEFERKREVVS
jgi:hypothetical protein